MAKIDNPIKDNRSLQASKADKRDEFYTQLPTIENELRHYRKHFKGKTVLCNCDDPFESKFFEYFVKKFNSLGLKKLIATCYVTSPIMGQQLSLLDVEPTAQPGTPYKAVVTKVYDKTGDGYVDMFDVKELFLSGENQLTELAGDGDYRSPECLELLKEADIVVTNPPFSQFRDYVATLMEYEKKFLIIGNQNAITYKEIFPLLKDNKVWLGYHSGHTLFAVPESYEIPEHLKGSDNARIRGAGYKIDENGRLWRDLGNICWYTNLDHKKRHEPIDLYKRYDPDVYPKYDNYDAIEVSKVANIPCDYDGVMGVPITFLDKYSPEQFEIVGGTGTFELTKALGVKNISQDFIDIYKSQGGKREMNSKTPLLCYYDTKGNAVIPYARILVKNKHPEKPRS